MKKMNLFLILLMTLSAFTRAQIIKNAEVRVLCVDEKAVPLPNQRILFENQHSKEQFRGKSDSLGRFTIQLPKNSSYLIKNQTLTFESSNSSIEIPNEKDSIQFDLTLTILPLVTKVYTLENVYFDFAKSTLRAESFAALNNLAQALLDKPSTVIEISGHTDNIGDNAANLTLSQKRAESVRNYLIGKKVSPGRITAIGYGANKPIADNATDEGRNKNRRTEVRILKD
jgi:OmpA-OmpF porin, OOP family